MIILEVYLPLECLNNDLWHKLPGFSKLNVITVVRKHWLPCTSWIVNFELNKKTCQNFDNIYIFTRFFPTLKLVWKNF